MVKKVFTGLALFALLLQGATMQDVQDMPANTWLTIPNSSFRHLDPCPERTCSYSRVMGLRGIFAWSGGAFNTKRNMFTMWGGGHNDYGGNEIYAFDVDNMTWSLLTQPSNPSRCTDANSDGTPTSRHTYGAIDYLPDIDAFWNWGGAIDCGGGGCAGNTSWLFDFATNTWTGHKPSGTTPGSMCPGSMASYDSLTKRVWFAKSGLYSYSVPLNTMTKHNSDYYYNIASAIDMKRGLLVLTGKGEVAVYNVRSGSLAKEVWSTTGGSGIISGGPIGLDYDPVADRIVGWDGGAVYSLNMDTRAWTVHNASGAPDDNGTGTYGSWRYVPSVNAFIAVTGLDDNVSFFKLTTGAGNAVKPAAGQVNSAHFKAHPNPFSQSTRLQVLGNEKITRLDIYSLDGKRVFTDSKKRDRIVWTADGLVPGVYIAKAKTGNKVLTRRLVLMGR